MRRWAHSTSCRAHSRDHPAGLLRCLRLPNLPGLRNLNVAGCDGLSLRGLVEALSGRTLTRLHVAGVLTSNAVVGDDGATIVQRDVVGEDEEALLLDELTACTVGALLGAADVCPDCARLLYAGEVVECVVCGERLGCAACNPTERIVRHGARPVWTRCRYDLCNAPLCYACEDDHAEDCEYAQDEDEGVEYEEEEEEDGEDENDGEHEWAAGHGDGAFVCHCPSRRSDISVVVDHGKGTTTVTGETFHVKEDIKGLGDEWWTWTPPPKRGLPGRRWERRSCGRCESPRRRAASPCASRSSERPSVRGFPGFGICLWPHCI